MRVDGEFIVGPPKSDAGSRDIAIPPHLLPMVKEHLAKHAGRRVLCPGCSPLLWVAADQTWSSQARTGLRRWRRLSSPLKVLIRIGAAIALALLLAPTPAQAHITSTTGFSEISEQGDQVRYELSLEYDLLAATLGLGQAALDAADDDERATVLAASQDLIDSYVDDNLSLSLDGVRCEPAIQETGVEIREGDPYAVIAAVYDCPGPAGGGYTVSYGIFSDAESVVDDHTNIVDYDLDGASGQFVFDSGHRGLALGESGVLSSSTRFLTLGVEHIAQGADHLVFVVALLLGARGLRNVLALAAAFTAAHSVTLGLAAFGMVAIPAQIVEPLIALSIAYVAADNLLGGGVRHRIPLTFGFGLVHGLGFASALTFDSDFSWTALASLLTFNLGIELGQAVVILALFPGLTWVRRRFAWSPIAHAVATSAIAVLGLTWFFTRLVG